MRLGRMIEFSKEMEIDLKIKYVGMSGIIGVTNSLGDDRDSDYSDGEDLETCNGFVGELTVINVERIAAV